MISHHIDFITTLVTKDQRIKTVIKIIKEVAAHFLKLGVRIEEMRMDSKFEPSRSELALFNIGLKTISKRKHIPDIERLNRIIK